MRKMNQLQRKQQRRKDLSMPLKQRRILQISKAMKIMNLLLKSKKLLQNLPKRIVLAAMTVKVQIRKSLLLKNLKRPPHQNLWRKMSL